MTRDDYQAERINSLIQLLVQSSQPRNTESIRFELYPNIETEAFNKKYRRDRQLLTRLGYIVDEQSLSAFDNSCWIINQSKTFAPSPSNEETHQNTLRMLGCLLWPLVSSDGFFYKAELLYALNKLGCLTATRMLDHYPTQFKLLSSNKDISSYISKHLPERKLCKLHYVSKSGNEHFYTAQIFALFTKNKHVYISAEVSEDTLSDIRELRVDRIVEASFYGKKNAFNIPEAYLLKDHVRLPFQIGVESWTLVCAIPEQHKKFFFADYMNKGTISEQNGETIWQVEVCNTTQALRWTISHGLIPLSPQSFVDQYKSRLEGNLR